MSLDLFEHELIQVSRVSKAYQIAYQTDPSYVQNKEFWLAFLNVEECPTAPESTAATFDMNASESTADHWLLDSLPGIEEEEAEYLSRLEAAL